MCTSAALMAHPRPSYIYLSWPQPSPLIAAKTYLLLHVASTLFLLLHSCRLATVVMETLQKMVRQLSIKSWLSSQVQSEGHGQGHGEDAEVKPAAGKLCRSPSGINQLPNSEIYHGMS